jgi:hypothetical protein
MTVEKFGKWNETKNNLKQENTWCAEELNMNKAGDPKGQEEKWWSKSVGSQLG